MVLLVATKKLRYNGKELGPGDQFEASDKDAMILRAIEKAEDVTVPKHPRVPLPRRTATTSTPPDPSPPALPTSDLIVVVESTPDTTPIEPLASELPVTEELAPHVSRYKRRDLQAQE